VAVKTLKAANVLELSEYVDEKLIQFYLESEALLRMQHPHVVQAVGLQRKQDPVQLCLEYCDGGDLVHYLRGLDIPVMTEMAAQVANGTKVSPSRLLALPSLHVAVVYPQRGCDSP
jgi:serine/threonine protein kinase